MRLLLSGFQPSSEQAQCLLPSFATLKTLLPSATIARLGDLNARPLIVLVPCRKKKSLLY